LLVHTPVLHRQPLLDDWWVVPRVVDHGAPEPWPHTGDGSAIALGARATGEAVPPPYMSRPALWAAWRAVVHVGGAIDSVALHALAWLAHAVSNVARRAPFRCLRVAPCRDHRRVSLRDRSSPGAKPCRGSRPAATLSERRACLPRASRRSRSRTRARGDGWFRCASPSSPRSLPQRFSSKNPPSRCSR
jgi:hypothetical protein